MISSDTLISYYTKSWANSLYSWSPSTWLWFSFFVSGFVIYFTIAFLTRHTYTRIKFKRKKTSSKQQQDTKIKSKVAWHLLMDVERKREKISRKRENIWSSSIMKNKQLLCLSLFFFRCLASSSLPFPLPPHKKMKSKILLKFYWTEERDHLFCV